MQIIFASAKIEKPWREPSTITTAAPRLHGTDLRSFEVQKRLSEPDATCTVVALCASNYELGPNGTYQTLCPELSIPHLLGRRHSSAATELHSGAYRLRPADPTNRDRSASGVHHVATSSDTRSAASAPHRLYTSMESLVSTAMTIPLTEEPPFEDQ